jgi:HEAT repeat protein
LGISQAVPSLVKALRDRDEHVRASAAKSLGQLGNAQAVPALTRALKDKDRHVQASAAEALREIRRHN